MYNLWTVAIAYLIKQCEPAWTNYMTPLCQTAHFDISSNCLFCGYSDKNYAWVWIDPCSNIQLPVDALNVSSCINARIEYIQDSHAKVYVYHICNNKK